MKECDTIKNLFAKYLRDDLGCDDAVSLRAHLLECHSCLDEAVLKDPLILFSLLSLQEKEETFWEGYWSRISEKITAHRGWPWSLELFRPIPAAAAIAIILIVTVVSIVSIFTLNPLKRPDGWGPVTMDYTSDEKPPVLLPEPLVDNVLQPTAKVITMHVGDTDVIMIFDENMDI
ncbi:MAG: hypothetical protein AB1756_00385 [Acidobacteriota bacterium]